MMLEPNPLSSLPQYNDEELADLNREFERLPASKIIQWAVDNYAPHLCLSASMTDARSSPVAALSKSNPCACGLTFRRH